MHSSDLSVSRAPYGLAFEIDDLTAIRRWAEERRLRVSVVLDCVMDGAEFEELLVLAPAGSQRRTMTVWRTQDGVCAQTPSSSPHGFRTVQDMLSHIRPVRARTPWRQRFGLA